MLKYPHEDMWIVKVVLFIPKPPNVWVSQGHCPNTIVDEALFMGAFLWPPLFSLCWTSRHFFSSRYYTTSNCLYRRSWVLYWRSSINCYKWTCLYWINTFLPNPDKSQHDEKQCDPSHMQAVTTAQLQNSVAMLDIKSIKQQSIGYPFEVGSG